MYNDRQSTKIRMKRTSVPTLCPCGEGRRLEATLRLVHQQGEDREITREARAKGVLIASLHTLRLKVLEEGHPSCQARTGETVVCTRYFCTRPISANKEELGMCPN